MEGIAVAALAVGVYTWSAIQVEKARQAALARINQNESQSQNAPASSDTGGNTASAPSTANNINTNEDQPSSPLGKLTERKSGYWKAKGIDPEILKEDILGGSGSKYDVYTDTKGNVWIKRKGEKDEKAIYAGKLEDLADDPTLKPDEDRDKDRRDKRGDREKD